MGEYRFRTRRGALCVFLFSLFCSLYGTSNAGSITASLTLPPGSYTLPSDMKVFVRATAVDGNPSDFTQSLVTFFSATDGPGSQIAVFLNLDDSLNYTLQYDCTGSAFPLPCRQFVKRLFLNSSATNDTVLRASEAELFAGNQDHTGINLPIQIGTALTGTLQTPNGDIATEDIELTILARNVTTPLNDLLALGFTIPMGSNSVDYKIHVPDDDGESWHIGYDCNSVFSTPCEDFIRVGYRKAGASNNTVEDYDDADELVGDVDQSGLNFRLLGGFSVSGSVIAPMAVADAAGLRVSVRVQDRNDPTNTFSGFTLIDQTETSADYFITVSLDPTADWVVNYTCDVFATPVECEEYLQQGFYDSGSMVETGNQVVTPLAGGESHSNIDLTLLTGPSLSGTLVLSDEVAPEGGLNFTVRAFETTGSAANFVSTVVIPEGETEIGFSLNVSADTGNQYRLSYDCNEGLTTACEEIVDEGFYDAVTETTVYVLEDANSLANSGLDVTDLLLTVDSSALLPPDDLCVPIKIATGGIVVICL